MTPQTAMLGTFGVWLASWLAAAVWSAPATARPDWRGELFHRLIVVVGAFMLFGKRPPRVVPDPVLWQVATGRGWGLVALAVAGLAFTWWARLHLGRLWSASVTRKADHRVVDSGPYALVRHPIYTGILTAIFAAAVLQGTVFALIGAGLVTLGWYIKARIEERFLREQLGAAQYNRYAARVPMLVPFTRLPGR